ncbi:pro-opiomelanocortin-like [Nematolebias whitei]|uniref:pro-opiomelanocortin-like n=1 Tax=Nematolebias whitei TaxID=451745 RepID=UPI001897DE45|nr:pro-opiomelanocortin-like [Nematolebias whitei]
MVCPRWLLIMVFMCRPGFGSLCCDFRDMDKILDCLHLCTSVTWSESAGLSESAQQRYNDDDNLLLSIILSTLTSEDRTSEFDPTAHRDERRSYSMEHFRWGKPPGRKRRPVKVFVSPLEGGLVPDLADLPLRARRHLRRSKAKGKGGVLKAGHQSQSWLRPRGRPSDLPEKKYGTYRMSHFRWGSPPATKRNGRFLKLREENQLAQFLQNILMKDV